MHSMTYTTSALDTLARTAFRRGLWRDWLKCCLMANPHRIRIAIEPLLKSIPTYVKSTSRPESAIGTQNVALPRTGGDLTVAVEPLYLRLVRSLRQKPGQQITAPSSNPVRTQGFHPCNAGSNPAGVIVLFILGMRRGARARSVFRKSKGA